MPLHQLFFYLTVLLLPTQLGKHFFPDWSLVLGRRLDYLSPTLFLTDVTIILTLLSWFVSKKHNFRISIGHWFLSSAFLQAGILILFAVLNTTLASSPFIALYKWFKVLEFVLFGLYIIKTKPSFSRTIWCLSVAILYSSIIAIAQFFLQHSVGGLFWFLGERTFDVATLGIARIQLLLPSIFRIPTSELLRPYATFPHPNVLGGFLAVILPLIIYKSDKSTSPTNDMRRIYIRITLVFGFIALILTFSRSSWLAFLILFVILKIKNWKFLSRAKSRKKIKNYLPVLGVLIFLLLTVPYFKTLTSDSESVYVRNELNSAALSIWKTSPVIGVGLGNFLVRLPSYYPHRDIFFLQPVHNIYLLILSETGVVGILFLFYFLWKMFKHIMYKRLFDIWHLSFIILLLLGAVDHYPLTLQQGQLLLTILASMTFIK